MTAQALLSRLDKVRRLGNGKWAARCPAHEDKAPSLSVRELDDGRTLVHCHALCEVRDVLGAVGLDLSDLFPEPVADDKRKPRERKPWLASDVIAALRHELHVAWIILGDVANGSPISDTDRERAGVAQVRCAALISELTNAR